jgi:hypothetical protein
MPHRGLAAPDLFLDTMLTEEYGRHAEKSSGQLLSLIVMSH